MDALIPENFGDSDLYLIPKGTGNLSPLNFRPISVTSTIYRLITKYFSSEFRKVASNHLSSEQRALLLDRTITSAVIDVRDTFLDRIHNMIESHLLQTDLRKAYDFLNRDAIISILEKLNYPPHLINLSRIALRPSKSFIRVGRSKKDQEIPSFSSVSGVKQGCPLAPYLYIITFDLFISKINPSLHPDILISRAYMDDLAVLLKSRKPLGKIGEIFQRYSNAVGAEMNFDKCCILSFPDDEPNSSLPVPWNRMKPSTSAVYLGVNISTKGKLEDMWAAPLRKAKTVARNISGHKLPMTSCIYLVNTFLISLFQYLFRFFLFPTSFHP